MPRPATRSFLPLVASLVLAAAVPALAQDGLPKRPEDLTFAPLQFTAPKAKDYRTTLSDGTAVYLAPSKEFPLINLTLTFKGGGFLDPADAVGLAGMTAGMVRSGGTATVKPAELDEKFDFLAARAGVAARGSAVTASLNSLASNFDESFALFMDMVRNPGFDAERLGVDKAVLLESMKQRNDSADAILEREWAAIASGPDHPDARQPTEATLANITPDAMRSMHARIMHPGNVIVAVSGDFDPTEMLARLEKAFAGWPKGEPVPDPPAPTAEVEPGVRYVQKDIPQGKVQIGLRTLERDDPDFIPMLVMNDILGGGGFSSRIMQSVRSNEGLAYSAGSRLESNPWHPGQFRASFQSKSSTVVRAIKLIDDEFRRIRSEPVSEAELATSKASYIETFPGNFASKDQMLQIFVGDEWSRRPEGYWETFREKVQAVTPDDITRVANKYLDPSRMAVIVVGNWADIYGSAGDDVNGLFPADRPATEIPLKDPLTLQPMVVLLGGAVLGARLGAASQCLYLMAGVAGLPVFAISADLSMGLLRLLGPTGGYLMAYPLAAAVVGALAQRGLDRRIGGSVLAMLAGLAVLFAGGVAWLAKDAGWQTALLLGFYPFVLVDVLKVAAAATLLPTAWRLLGRQAD